jgi:hypothetical protein
MDSMQDIRSAIANTDLAIVDLRSNDTRDNCLKVTQATRVLFWEITGTLVIEGQIEAGVMKEVKDCLNRAIDAFGGSNTAGAKDRQNAVCGRLENLSRLDSGDTSF